MNNQRIEAIKEEIKKAHDSIQDRIVTIEIERQQHEDTVNGYTTKLINAIQDDMSDEEIDKLSAERDRAELKIKQCDELLHALRADPGSKLNRLRAELVRERFDVIKQLEKEAQLIEQEAEKYREKLCEQMGKLADLHKQHQTQRLLIDQTPLDAETAYDFRLKSSVESNYRDTLNNSTNDKVLKVMYELAVHPNQFFQQ